MRSALGAVATDFTHLRGGSEPKASAEPLN